MENTIVSLAYIRQVVGEREATLAAYETELHTTQLWKALEERRASLQKARTAQSDLEVKVRKAAMKTFVETDDRTPHPAVKIKDFTALDYDDEDAIEYAREHLPKALKLVKRVFDKAAKVLELDFVVIWQEPRATIARNLSKYLPGDEEDIKQ